MSESIDPPSPEESAETLWERFARIYATPPRGQRLWDQWMETQTEMTRAVMEKVAADTAEERQVSIAEAKTYLALQKLIADRGKRWVERFVNQQALAESTAQRTLKPMVSGRRKRSGR